MHPEDDFTGLYQRHYRSIWVYVGRRVPATSDPADVTAEVFTTAWRLRRKIPAEPETLLWLYATARRVVANSTRSQRRRNRLLNRLTGLRESQELLDTGATPDDLAAAALSPEILTALARLRPGDREAIRLAVWEDLAVADIAVVLGCSPNAASQRLRRARQALRAQLGPPAAPVTAATSPTHGTTVITGDPHV